MTIVQCSLDCNGAFMQAFNQCKAQYQAHLPFEAGKGTQVKQSSHDPSRTADELWTWAQFFNQLFTISPQWIHPVSSIQLFLKMGCFELSNSGSHQIFVFVVNVIRAPETSSVRCAKDGFVAKPKNCFSGAAFLYSWRNFSALGHMYLALAFSISFSLAVMKTSGDTLETSLGSTSSMLTNSSKLHVLSHLMRSLLIRIRQHRLRLVGSPKFAGLSLGNVQQFTCEATPFRWLGLRIPLCFMDFVLEASPILQIEVLITAKAPR